jgi:hypothetical protein
MNQFPPSFRNEYFNTSAFSSGAYLTLNEAIQRFAPISIGSLLSGITSGTVSPSKCVIVDANKDITGFRNITTTGNLTLSSISPTLSLISPLTINESLFITGGTLPTIGSGITLRYVGIASTAYLRAYNYSTSAYNHLSINDGALYIKNDGSIGIGNSTPAVKLHVSGAGRMDYLQIKDSTDTSRLISCLNSSLSATQSSYITLGRANTAGNQAELGFYYAGDNNASNRLDLGFHSTTICSILKNGRLGIATTAPGYTLDVVGDINTSESYRMDGTQVINSSLCFVGQGGVSTTGNIETSGRLKCANDLGLQVFPAIGTGTTEWRVYCSATASYIGNQTAKPMFLGVNDSAKMTICANGNVSFFSTTNDTYPVSINKSDGDAGSTAYGYINSTPSTGNGNDTNATVSLYLSGRLLATGEVDIASDKRIKTNIELLDDEFCNSFINMIQPKKFNYLNEPKKISFGWIAQDILKSGFKDLINIRPNDDMKEEIDDDGFLNPAGYQFAIMTGNIVPILHKAIQLILIRLTKLEKKINRHI